MLEKPDLPDHRLISRVQDAFGLAVAGLTFLPLGADVNTAVYRLVAADETVFFLKLRKGAFDEITVTVPQFLKDKGIQSIIAPLETRAGQLWADLDEYRLILYPFVEGENGYHVALTDQQWLDFGAALRTIHTARVPAELARSIPHETYPAQGRDLVRSFQAQVEADTFDDPVAAKFAACMRGQRGEIDQLVARAGQLGLALQARPLEQVLCHSDVHPGNLLIGANNEFFIVDWDNPIFAPKERDLLLIGGMDIWNGEREKALFYQGYSRGYSRGYGPAAVDRMALAYYRCERIIQDIAEFCKQVLSTSAGGEDREQAYEYFSGQFLPGQEVELALNTG